MENSDWIFDKIWGSWTGKIAGGTFGMPVEGWRKDRIQKLNPPLTGWIQKHKQVVNDDEQFEFIALMALEQTPDEELAKKLHLRLAAPGTVDSAYTLVLSDDHLALHRAHADHDPKETPLTVDYTTGKSGYRHARERSIKQPIARPVA